MKKKKAFTLIELLAVIVILAIIALIVTVTIGNIIDNAKKETYKNSVRNIITAGEHFVSQYIIDNNKDLSYPVTFTCDGTDCKNENYKLQVSGVVPRSGKVIVESQKNIRVEYLYNGSYCASGIKESIQVAKTCTDIDITKPTIIGIMSGKNVILTLTDNESGIGSYCVTTVNDFNNCTWLNTTSTNVTHPLAVSGTYYAFARDKKLNVSDSIMFDTGDIEDPSLTSTLSGKVVSSTFSDNVAVTDFCLSEEDTSTNCEWEVLEENQTTKDVTLVAAGTYYVYVKDGVGNITRSNGIVAPSSAFCELALGESWQSQFGAGTSTKWVSPCDGLYQLEVWGAQGGGAGSNGGGRGGYSSVYVVLSKNDELYATVGTAGGAGRNDDGTSSGGYNGGGPAKSYTGTGGHYNALGAGGGATHIAKVSGTLTSIGYDSFVTQGNGLVVAGGGGGRTWNQYNNGYNSPGAGGGYLSSTGNGRFGQGSGYNVGITSACPGGGGGLYGGTSGSYHAGTGGGVGYVINEEIIYNNVTYSSVSENGVQPGNGKAKITLIAY